jgi:hypothetical protein
VPVSWISGSIPSNDTQLLVTFARSGSDSTALGATGAAGPGYIVSSDSAVSLTSSGTKTFNVDTVGAYIPTQRIRAAVDTGVFGFMDGVITSVNYTGTQQIVMTADTATGSIGTTYSVWAFAVVGEKGPKGLDGVQGNPGNDAVGYDGVISNSQVYLWPDSDQQFVVNNQKAYVTGTRLRAVAADSINTLSFVEGTVFMTLTNWVMKVDYAEPILSTSTSYSDWRFSIAGTATTTTNRTFKILNTSIGGSTTTGALQVVGGVGIGGNLAVGQWFVPMQVSSATVKTMVGTPTGAMVFLTGTNYFKPAYWDGVRWNVLTGSVLG